MFSSPAPASGSRNVAASALRKAGLIDKDTQMRDGDKNSQGGKKVTPKSRRRVRGAETAKVQTLGSSQRSMIGKTLTVPSTQLAARPTSSNHAGPSDPLSIRGAARPTPAGRFRRKDGETAFLPKQGAVDAWRQLVNKRYDPNTRFLNLESMIDDEVVKKHSLSPPGYGGDSRTAAVIFKLASHLKPEVVTLSLANNNLNGVHLIYLDKYLPKLRNLSLQGNMFKTWKDLDFISGKRDKMKHLRELVVSGTPLRDMEYKNGRGDRFRSEIARRFVALEVLDQEVITQIGFTNDSVPGPAPTVPKPSATTFPCEMGPSFITGVDGALVSNFLVRFFQLFDTQRNGLVDAYDSQATFSYCCNTGIPARARIENLYNILPNQKKLSWEPWLKNSGGGSRNLSRREVNVEKTLESLHTGPAKIIAAQAALPETKHDVSAGEKFIVDAFPVPHGQGNALLLTLHGEFMEARSQGLRSFDRAFILLPAPEGSIAKLAGWDVIILSDQLTIRSYSSSNAWTVGPMLVQAEDKSKNMPKPAEFLPSSLPPPQQQVLNTLPEAQRQLVLSVCARTRLNVNYAVECLNGNAWDLERAITNFEQVKETLPKDAFL